MIKAKTADELYPRLFREVMEKGVTAAPRGRAVKELYNVSWGVEDASRGIILNPARKMHCAYAVIEMLGLLRDGQRNVEPFTFYCPAMRRFINPKTGLWDGSYADRINMYGQMRKMYEILKADPDSRRAVIGIYNPRYDFHAYESLDICCTLNLIFTLRDGKLHLTGTMRSNDVFLGIPYDLTQFTFLQAVLASWLGVEVGSYCHFAANTHIYERDWGKLAELEQASTPETHPFASMPAWDIPEIPETMAQVQRFFSVEYALRQEPTESALAKLLLKYDISSRALQHFARGLILPFLRRKKDN